jgi:hypothetical protein
LTTLIPLDTFDSWWECQESVINLVCLYNKR